MTSHKFVSDAAKAHTDLNTFGIVVSVLEGGHLYNNRSDRAADDIIKICKREMMKRLVDYDAARARAHDSPPHERSEGEQTERPGAVDAYTKGLHAGREEMQERAAECAETCLNIENPDERYGDGIEDAERLIARAIRSLPLPAEGEDTPHG